MYMSRLYANAAPHWWWSELYKMPLKRLRLADQSVQSVSDCSVSSSVRLFCFSQSVEDYFRISQLVRIKGISY
jgi:hypothetical protein